MLIFSDVYVLKWSESRISRYFWRA